jgi:hypothetical protein
MTGPSKDQIAPDVLLHAEGYDRDVVAAVSRQLQRFEEDDKLSQLETIYAQVTPDGVVRAKSKKISNWLFNWKSLLIDLLPIGGGAVKVSDALGAALLALRIVQTLSANASIQLGDLEARIVVELWRDPADRTPMSDEELRSRLQVTEEAYDRAIMRLSTLGVVARSDDNGRLVRTEQLVFE